MARPTIDELLRRAERFAAHAKREAASSDPADWQNAAGKGWQAARLAAEAVVACKTGRRPRGTKTLLDELERLTPKAGRPDSAGLGAFSASVERAYSALHLSCGEDGDCGVRSRRRAERVGEDIVPGARALCCAHNGR